MRASFFALSLMLSLIACGGGEGGAAGPDTGDTNQVKAWSASIEARATSAAEAHQSLLDAIRIASGDFSVNLSTTPAPADAVAPFDAALAAAIEAQAEAFAAGVDVALWAARAAEAPTGSGGGGGGLEIRRQPLVFFALIAVGVAVTRPWRSRTSARWTRARSARPCRPAPWPAARSPSRPP